MVPDVAEAHTALNELERDPQLVAGPRFPDVSNPLQSLHAQRRMARIRRKASERRVHAALLRGVEPSIGPLEARGPFEPQRFSEAMSSSTLSARYTRPALMSASASRSPFCHSGVQNQA